MQKLKIVKNYCNNYQAQFFTYLLALFLAGWPYFYLSCVGLVGLIVDLAVSLAINGAISRIEKIVVGMSKWSL